MAIFRGDGGAGDSNTDATLTAVTAQAVIATNKASEAATSAGSASSSETAAANSASAAATSATGVSAYATAAQNSANAAAASATGAATSATSATTAKTAAETAETNAETAETNAETAETNAAASATTATTKAAEAVTSASGASTSASTATTKASEAATSATNAANSESAVATNATNAANSATAAASSASGASTSATNAATSATAAAASAASIGTDPSFNSVTVTGTTAVKMSAGTTAQRPTGVAGQFRYNTTEGKFEGYTTEWGEIGGGAADLLLNSFTGDGSDVTFSLSGAAIENNTLVYVDGVYQNKSTYAVSGATPAVVTFSEAPANGSAIEIMVAAIAVTNVGTPSDNTVTTAKIVNNAVTTAKIADGAITSAKLGSGVGGAFNDFAIKTTAYTAVSRDQLIVNSSSAVTITLPASPAAGNVVFIKNAGTGTVTVGRNGSKINSTTDDGSLAADAGATLVYVDATIGWKEL
jgi:hypothetical protein